MSAPTTTASRCEQRLAHNAPAGQSELPASGNERTSDHRTATTSSVGAPTKLQADASPGSMGLKADEACSAITKAAPATGSKQVTSESLLRAIGGELDRRPTDRFACGRPDKAGGPGAPANNGNQDKQMRASHRIGPINGLRMEPQWRRANQSLSSEPSSADSDESQTTEGRNQSNKCCCRQRNVPGANKPTTGPLKTCCQLVSGLAQSAAARTPTEPQVNIKDGYDDADNDELDGAQNSYTVHRRSLCKRHQDELDLRRPEVATKGSPSEDNAELACRDEPSRLEGREAKNPEDRDVAYCNYKNNELERSTTTSTTTTTITRTTTSRATPVGRPAKVSDSWRGRPRYQRDEGLENDAEEADEHCAAKCAKTGLGWRQRVVPVECDTPRTRTTTTRSIHLKLETMSRLESAYCRCHSRSRQQSARSAGGGWRRPAAEGDSNNDHELAQPVQPTQHDSNNRPADGRHSRKRQSSNAQPGSSVWKPSASGLQICCRSGCSCCSCPDTCLNLARPLELARAQLKTDCPGCAASLDPSRLERRRIGDGFQINHEIGGEALPARLGAYLAYASDPQTATGGQCWTDELMLDKKTDNRDKNRNEAAQVGVGIGWRHDEPHQPAAQTGEPSRGDGAAFDDVNDDVDEGGEQNWQVVSCLSGERKPALSWCRRCSRKQAGAAGATCSKTASAAAQVGWSLCGGFANATSSCSTYSSADSSSLSVCNPNSSSLAATDLADDGAARRYAAANSRAPETARSSASDDDSDSICVPICDHQANIDIVDDDDDDDQFEEPSLSASFPPPIEQAESASLNPVSGLLAIDSKQQQPAAGFVYAGAGRPPLGAFEAGTLEQRLGAAAPMTPSQNGQKQQQEIKQATGKLATDYLSQQTGANLSEPSTDNKSSFQPERAYLKAKAAAEPQSAAKHRSGEGANGHCLSELLAPTTYPSMSSSSGQPIGEIRCKSDEQLEQQRQQQQQQRTTILEFKRKFRVMGRLVSFIQTSGNQPHSDKHGSSHSTSASNNATSSSSSSSSTSRSSSAASSGSARPALDSARLAGSAGSDSSGLGAANNNRLSLIGAQSAALRNQQRMEAESGAALLSKDNRDDKIAKVNPNPSRLVDLATTASSSIRGEASSGKQVQVGRVSKLDWKSAQNHHQQSKKRRQANMDIRREKKAAKTLAIITGVFVCCWLPFFLNAIIMPACGPACTPSDLILSVLLWLGYLNSLLNPIIYTIFSPDFRRAFRRLLCWPQRVANASSRFAA